MVRFEELQDLWRSQRMRLPEAFDMRGLTRDLERFGRRQTWINLTKAVLLVLAFGRMMWRLDSLAPELGVALMLVGVVTYLAMDWRNQMGLSRLDFSAPSVEFVRSAHERLRHQLNPMRRVFWLFVITVGGGFNLIVLGAPHAPLLARLARHLGATATPFAAYAIGIKVREFRFKRECGAVMERLAGLLAAMEGKSL